MKLRRFVSLSLAHSCCNSAFSEVCCRTGSLLRSFATRGEAAQEFRRAAVWLNLTLITIWNSHVAAAQFFQSTVVHEQKDTGRRWLSTASFAVKMKAVSAPTENLNVRTYPCAYFLLGLSFPDLTNLLLPFQSLQSSRQPRPAAATYPYCSKR